MLTLYILAIQACTKQHSLLDSSNEITKAQRTQLGNTMRDYILIDSTTYFILPKSYPPYQATYEYLQKLYDQAYYFLRDDWSASQDNQWNRDRQWELFILRSEDKIAFCLPGGDIFVSTGLLETLQYEYELYYILSFEAIIMHHEYLLNQLVVRANSAADLVEIIENGVSSTNVTLEDLTTQLFNDIAYTETKIVQEIDLQTNQLVCTSSFYDRLAIIYILNKLENTDKWLQTRPSYTSRTDYILNDIVPENNDECGTKKWANTPSEYTNFISALP